MRLVTNSLRRFSTTSFYQIANFDPDLLELQKIVRKFAEEKVAPLAEKTDR